MFYCFDIFLIYLLKLRFKLKQLVDLATVQIREWMHFFSEDDDEDDWYRKRMYFFSFKWHFVYYAEEDFNGIFKLTVILSELRAKSLGWQNKETTKCCMDHSAAIRRLVDRDTRDRLLCGVLVWTGLHWLVERETFWIFWSST